MTEVPAPDRATFTNPLLRARLSMVRLLQIVDELERATATGDDYTAVDLARQAIDRLESAREAVNDAVDSLAERGARATATDPDSPEAIQAGDSWAAPEPELSQADLRGQWGDK